MELVTHPLLVAHRGLVASPVLAEQQMVGLRGVATVLVTLAFVGVCFATVDLLDRRRRASAADGHDTPLRTMVDAAEPIDDVWPMHAARTPVRRSIRIPADRVVAGAVGGSFAALLVALALIPVREQIGLASISLALVLVVVAAAALGGRVAAAVSSAAAALSFNFLHTAPLYTFHIAATRNVVASVLMVLIGIAVGELAVRPRPDRARTDRPRQQGESS